MKHSVLPYYGQFFERFSFWGLQSVLVLYLTVGKHLPVDIAYQDYGFFTCCAFILALLGGIVADKFIGFRATLFCGISLDCLGNIILASGYTSLLSFGLMSIALGSGLFLSSNPNLLALQQTLYPLKRLNNITLLYLAENIAFIIGSFGYGLIWNTFGIKYCFILSACLLAIYLIKFASVSGPILNTTIARSALFDTIKAVVFLLITLLMLTFFMQLATFKNSIIAFAGIGTIAYLVWVIFCATANERPALLALIVIFSICLLFFTMLFQMNSSLLMFIQAHVQKTLYGMNMPASVFAAAESLFAILWAPVFSVIWTIFNRKMLMTIEIRKVALSLLLQSIGFYIFIRAMHLAVLHPGGISPFTILPGYALLGAGDICLMPTVINAVTVWSPAQYRGIFMGIFYVMIGFSGYLAGNLASFTAPLNYSTNPLLHTIFVYHQFNLFAFIVAFLALLLSLLLRRRY